MGATEGRDSRGRGGPSLATWCKSRTPVKVRHHNHHDTPRDARRTLNAILRTSRRLGVRAEDLGRLRGAQALMSSRRARTATRPRKSLAHDPDFLAAGILFALMIAVLAGVLAAMLIADSEHAGDLPGNKSVSGGALRDVMLRARQQDDQVVDAAMVSSEDDGAADDEDDEVPAYLLELLQHHRQHSVHGVHGVHHLEEDLILEVHDDYRERYDGFDQPPPFRRRHKSKAPPAAKGMRAVDLEISEEEAFSTRVFVTTPRRQR